MRTVVRVAVGISAVTIAARVVGLARVAVLARTVGDDPLLADTYQAANTVPNVVFEIVAGGALAAVVVPSVAGALERGDAEAVRRITGGLLTWAVVLLTPVMLLGILLREPILRLVTGDPARVELGAPMLAIFAPQVVLYGIGIVLGGVLQAHSRFLGPAVAPLLSSLVVIVTYLVYDGSPTVLAAGTTLGVVVLSLSLLARLPVRPAFGFTLPRGLGALAGYAAAGVIAQQLVLLLVLRLAAPTLGGVLVYSVAYTVFLLPWAVLAVPVATSAFPALSRAAAAGDDRAYAETLVSARRTVLFTAVLAAVGMVLFAGVGARLLLGVRELAAGPDELAAALRAFAPGLPGYGLLALLSRAAYARDDGRSAAVATVAGFGVAAVADLLLVNVMGDVTALALGHSIGVTVGALLLWWRLR